jgi:hypothetical protein
VHFEQLVRHLLVEKKYFFVILLETLPHFFSFGVVRVKGDGEVYR